MPDEEGAARDVTRFLLDAGRRSIAFIDLPGLLAGELRETGFRAALEEAGLDGAGATVLPAVRRSVYGDRAHSLVSGHVSALMTGANPPDAILCGNDRVVMEVYTALHRLGRHIPDDVAVAGFDNQIDIATRLDPPLTTMALPHRVMGRMAADILLAPEIRRLPFQLVERASV